MMHHTQRLAMANGRVSFESGLSMIDANPYRRSSASHRSFVKGFLEAQRKATPTPTSTPADAVEGGSK